MRVDFKQVLEKEELATRVFELVTDERKRLERRRLEEERELEEQRPSTSPPSDGLDSATKPAPSGPAPNIDQGLCVVCQDEEATLAVVDCGHLAMCQRESPLRRTNISLLRPNHGNQQRMPPLPHAHHHTVSTHLYLLTKANASSVFTVHNVHVLQCILYNNSHNTCNDSVTNPALITTASQPA